MTTRTNTRLQGRTEGYEEERKATRKNGRLRGRTEGYEEEQKATRKNRRDARKNWKGYEKNRRL